MDLTNPAIKTVLDRIYIRYQSIIDDIAARIKLRNANGEDYLLYNALLGSGGEVKEYFVALGFEVALHKGHTQDLLAFGWTDDTYERMLRYV